MSEPLPSGTVVVLRDEPRFEFLLLQRRSRPPRPGAWVFPGGKVEAGDRRPGDSDAVDARRAAVREAAEESGLALETDALCEIARWITPKIGEKRFDTWFFATAIPGDAEIRVDGEEIAHHRWLTPDDALAEHHARSLRLAPPTFITVSWLAEFGNAADALRELPERLPPPIHPHIHRVGDGACMLYPGDAGYENGELDAPGARHRLWAQGEPWRYERRGL